MEFFALQEQLGIRELTALGSAESTRWKTKKDTEGASEESWNGEIEN